MDCLRPYWASFEDFRAVALHVTIAPKYLTTSHPLQATSFPRNLLEQATKGFLVRFGMPPRAHKQKDRGLPASGLQSTKTPVSQSHSLPGHVSMWHTYLDYKGQRKVEEKQKARGKCLQKCTSSIISMITTSLTNY